MNIKSNTVTKPSTEIGADPASLQALVNRRLALRLGLTLPVAAAVAALGGIGPQNGRAGR